MRKKLLIMFLAATVIVSFMTACQKNGKAGSDSVKIYYAVIEDGDYYEEWV